MANFPQWEYDLLQALGAPTSQNNLSALNLWAQSEGSVTNNPLATSGEGAGATTCVAQCGTSSPVYEYATEADGVAQMASFLKGSYYTAVVRAFVQDSGLAAIFQAINSSPWCKGCQNGQYPVALSQAVGGAKFTASTTVGTGGSSNPGAPAGSKPGSGLSKCVVQAPGFLFLSGPCFLTKGGVKWLSGAVCIVAGTVIAGFGVALLASAVGKSTGATDAFKGAAGTAKKGAKVLGIGASLAAGQPEAAAGIAAVTKGSPKASPAASRPASPRPPRSPERTARLRESNRLAQDIASTTRPNNRGLSRQPSNRSRPGAGFGLSRESTQKNRDFERRKAEADAKAKAANF